MNRVDDLEDYIGDIFIDLEVNLINTVVETDFKRIDDNIDYYIFMSSFEKIICVTDKPLNRINNESKAKVILKSRGQL